MPGRPEIRRGIDSQDAKLVPMMNCSPRLPLATVPIKDHSRLVFIALTVLLLSLPSATALGQGTSAQRRDAMLVDGTGREPAGGAGSGVNLRPAREDALHL